VHLAYKLCGDGALTLVFMPVGNMVVDLLWDEPGFARFARRVSRLGRTVWFDARGVGASGGHTGQWRTEEFGIEEDVTAVGDAIGCEKVVLIESGGSAEAIRYAVLHPERVAALVLINAHAHYVRDDDYPCGLPAELLDRYFAAAREQWGSGISVDLYCPSKSSDERFRAWWSLGERLGVGVDLGASILRRNFVADVRPLLPEVCVPTLVLHRVDNRAIRVEAGRYLAEHIPGATYVELSGADHPYYVGDTDELVDEIQEFLTGTRSAPEGDVVTTTVLFTDIVASTEQSARLGHRRWTALTEEHNEMVRSVLGNYRGREIKTIGDGFLATFDATTRAVRAAVGIVTSARASGLDVRAGVHIGEVEVRPDDVVGLTVSIAKRICDLADPASVFASRPVRDLVISSGIEFTDRGEYELKGVPGTWKLFAVTS
jgi:class 3 adenylate cyclase